MADRWRVGTKVPRNLYRGNEPIAMLASADTARFIAERLNRVIIQENLLAACKAALEQWTLYETRLPADHWIKSILLDAIHDATMEGYK